MLIVFGRPFSPKPSKNAEHFSKGNNIHLVQWLSCPELVANQFHWMTINANSTFCCFLSNKLSIILCLPCFDIMPWNSMNTNRSKALWWQYETNSTILRGGSENTQAANQPLHWSISEICQHSTPLQAPCQNSTSATLWAGGGERTGLEAWT